MNKYYAIICFFFFFFKLEAQVKGDSSNLKYLEDQIYLSLSYNILIKKPQSISQNGFSGGVSFGFIKDLPVNKHRTFGFGVGVGYTYNVYIQNLKISPTQPTLFEIAQDYTINRLRISTIDVPIEVRWRNSTPHKYKFMRVYGGIKFSYVVASKTTFRDLTETITAKNIAEINKFQYGLMLATGYSTWNLYIYYSLKSFFKDVPFNGNQLNLKDLSVGLKFYIM